MAVTTRRGRPSKKHDPAIAEKVIELAACGNSQEAISSSVGMSAKTLRKVYENELRQGMGQANIAVTSKLFDSCMAGNVAALIFWAKCRMGWSEKASFNGREILERYQSGELSLKDAALELEINGLPLPETIKILLAKEEPEPLDPAGCAYCTISDEEMERRVAERRAAIEAQVQGLPERQKGIRELRERVKDKFAPEHSTERGGNG